MSFSDRTNQLNRSLGNASGESSCGLSSTMLMVGALVPVIIGLILYFGLNSWILDNDNPPKVSMKKFAMYLIMGTLVVWGIIYGYSVYSCE